MLERVNIIGVPISAVNMRQTLEILKTQHDALQKSYICVANVYTTVMAHQDPRYWQVQANSALTLPDGKPLSVVGRRLGHAQMEQVRGVDLMKILLASSGYRCYFYGNTPEHLQQLIQTLQAEYPACQIAGYEPSVFRELTEEEMDMLAKRIRDTKADILWVGLGAPLQETFCARIAGKSGAVPIGVGGAFNVLAHVVPDAPHWMQKCGLEWLYRFSREPRRLFKRYFVTNAQFLWYLVTRNKAKGDVI